MGCNFCTTSAFFGGKGKILNFYETGERTVPRDGEAEKTRNKRSFFIMDENFLLQKRRAMELLALMKAAGKSWTFNIFSSANAIRKYTYEELVELGISWIWLGLESRAPDTPSCDGADTLALTRELREHGIVLLGSTIIGLEHHTPENIGEEIEHAIAHETDFHQFMLYTPVPGTPLYHEMARTGPPARRGPGRHSRPAQIQLQARGNLARRIEEVPRLGLPARFRAQRSEPLPHLPHHLRRLDALQEPPGPRASASAGSAKCRTAPRLGRLALGDGAPPEAVESRGGGEDSRAAQEMEHEFGLIAVVAGKLLGPVLWWTSRREEKRLPPAKATSPPRSSTAATG